jgi:hypothetical protein
LRPVGEFGGGDLVELFEGAVVGVADAEQVGAPSSGVVLAACTHGVRSLGDILAGGCTPPPGNIPTHVEIDPFPTPAPAAPGGRDISWALPQHGPVVSV